MNTFSKATNIFRKATSPTPKRTERHSMPPPKSEEEQKEGGRKAIVHPSPRPTQQQGSVSASSIGSSNPSTLSNSTSPTLGKKLDTFPVRLRTYVDQIPVIVRCSPGQTVQDFIKENQNKILEISTLLPEQVQLLTEENQVLGSQQVISENNYVQNCRGKEAMPVLIVREKNDRKRFLSEKGATKEGRSLTFSKTLKKINEVDVQFILPNGQTKVFTCRIDHSLAQIKETLKGVAPGHLPKPTHTYVLKTPEGYLDDESLSIGDVPYIETCRKEGVMPSVIIVEKSAAISKKEKKINMEIGALIGSPIVWTQDDYDTEITQFRKSMQWVRYQERKALGTAKQAPPQTPVPETDTTKDDTPLSPSKNFAKIRLPLLEVSKTFVLNEKETVEQLKLRVFEKHYVKKTNKPPSSYVLKVSGFAEYLSDEWKQVVEVDYVKSCLATNKKIELVLVEDDVPDDPEKLTVEDFPAEEFLEDVAVHYDHETFSIKNVQWDQMTRFSIWDFNIPFRIKIVGIENVANEFQSGFLFVSAGMYHSGKEIASSKPTQLVLGSTSPRWYQQLVFDIELRNVPREARLCFTLYSSAKKDDLTNKQAIASVNLLLFDYKLQLRTGLISLNMWPGESNPIGTCVANNKSVTATPTLFVQLDSYEVPVVFPTEPANSPEEVVADKRLTTKLTKMTGMESELNSIFKKDALFQLSPSEKAMLWEGRANCFGKPGALPKLLQSVAYNDRNAVQQMHQLVQNWPLISPVEALELLDSNFADIRVREYAVRCLEELSDDELLDYLLQLTQVLKYENYHDSVLARFLLRRALRNKQIGHYFFWYLKSEVEVPEISERYSLLLEAYLRGCGIHRVELNKQANLLRELARIANFIKPLKDTDRKEVLLRELAKLTFPGGRVQLPLNPSLEIKSLRIEKCRYMDSKKLPLWLVFNNYDENAPSKYVIFKSGDDLRQDMLTLQMIRLMDKFWRKEGLDLKMSPYRTLATANEEGMIEVVLNAETIANISKLSGGITAAFKEEPIYNWLLQQNPTPEAMNQAIENFIYSCAGYCVATYVLGIGDRHNDNIMLTKDGLLFHIDFGHFLGNFKTKLGFKRERAPFVFTPDFAFVMGKKGAGGFEKFEKLCCQAYNIVRKHSNLFINLFELMLSTGIPELKSAEDIEFLRDHLMLEASDEQASATFVELIHESLGTMTTQVNNMFHLMKHNKTS